MILWNGVGLVARLGDDHAQTLGYRVFQCLSTHVDGIKMVHTITITEMLSYLEVCCDPI